MGRPSQATQKMILDMLPATCTQIALALGMHRDTVQTELRRQRIAGEIHISSWGTSDAGRPECVFSCGAGEDVACDRSRNAEYLARRYAQRYAREKARRQSQTIEQAMDAAAKRARARTMRTVGRRDELTAAFFGGMK